MNKCVDPVIDDTAENAANNRSSSSDVNLRVQGLSRKEIDLTEDLIRAMANGLGLKLDQLTIAIDDGSGKSLRVHGAHGRTHNNLIELDPARFNPKHHNSRTLLAHELTHAAQARNPATITSPLRAIEAEARANAHAASLGRPLTLPLERLNGSAFEAPAEVTGAQAVTSLETLVERNYRRERATIERLLSGVIVTNGEVEQVLRILEPLAFETASALVESLEPEFRLRLVDELNRPHYLRFRSQIIATFAALSVEELHQQDEDLLERVTFDSLTPAELIAVQRAFHHLPRSAQTELSEGDRSSEFRTLRRSPPGEYNAEEALQEQATAEEQRSQSVVLADNDLRVRVHRLSMRLQALLREPNVDNAHTALRLIGGLAIQPRPDSRMAAEATSPIAAEQAELETQQAAQADGTAEESTAQPPPQPEDAPAQAAQGLQMAALRIIASDLDEEGAIERLIDVLPEQDRQQPALRDAFRLLMSARTPHRNLALVEELLDPGFWFFGWVDRHEAMLAYDIVMSMPLVERERFRQLENGDALRRMLDALPEEFRHDPNFRLPEVARTADGSLIEADRLYAPGGLRDSETEMVGATLELFRNPEQAEDTQVLLDNLLAIARLETVGADDALAPRRDAVLSTVVRRLDAEGLFEPFLARLSPEQLASRENWPDMARIFSARDPLLARLHILRLLDERHFLFISLDSVQPREAFLVFHLIRALPAADREAIESAEGGEPWSRMLAQLSNRTLAEAGFTYFRAGLDQDGTNAVRARLNDDQIWDGEHNDQLIAVIELARATGEFAYVFETSRLRQQAGLNVPAAITVRYRLYDEAAGRTELEPIETDLEVDDGSTLALIFGTGWRELDLNYVYSDPVDFMGSEYRDASVSSIRLTADLEQLQDIMGGRLHPVAEVARTSEERTAISPENREQLLSTPNVIDMMLDLERGLCLINAAELRFDNVRYLSSGFTLRTGAIQVSGLRLSVGFDGGDLIALRSFNAELNRLAVDTPVYTTEDSAISARSAVMTTLHAAAGDFSQEQTEAPIVGHLMTMILAAAWRYYVSHRQIVEDPLERAALFDRVDLSFENLTIDELHTAGGQRLGQTTITDAHVAAATNRAAYQRLLVESLNRRLATTTDPDTRERLQQQLETASAEAARLEPLEQEYRTLVRRLNRQDGRLTDEEARRLAELQEDEDLAVGGQMGAIVDIGQIRVEGIDGTVRANDVELNGLHGEGEFSSLYGFSVEQLTTEQQISRFVQFGPEAMQTHLQGELPSDSRFAMEIPSASIGGLVIQGNIPSSLEVTETLMELPGTTEFAAERARLQALITRLMRYEALTHREEPTDPADRISLRRQIMEERRALAELFGAEVQQLQVTDIRLGAQPTHEGRLAPEQDREEDPDRPPNRARGNIGIGTLDMHGVRYGAIEAQRIYGTGLRGEVQLRTPGFSAYGDPSAQFEVAVFGGESLIINNAHMGETPNRADRIQIDGFDGTARLNDRGLTIENFHIDDMEVENAHYRTATAYLWSQGTTHLQGINLTLNIPYEAANSEGAEGAAEPQPPSFSRLDTTTFNIINLHVNQISADQLGYRGFDEHGGFSKEVIVESGFIGHLDVNNFTLTMPEGQDMGYHGDVTIRTLDQTQFRARIGESMSMRGQLDTGTREEDAPAITVGIASSEEIYLNLDQIDLTQGAVDLRTESGHGRVLVRQAELSGDIAMIGNQIQVRNFRAPHINMPSIQWTTSSGAEVTAQNAHLHDFRLNLDYTTVDDENSTVQINELYVGSFSADSIIYSDPPGVHVSLTQETDEENGRVLPLIQGLRLQDLYISIGPDSFTMSGGHGRIENADVVTSALMQAETGSGPNRYEGVTGLFARISAGGITFSDLGYGNEGLTLTGGIERLNAEGGFDIMPADPDGAPAGATNASGDFTISHGRIGQFRYGNGLIQIGPDGSEGLMIDEIVMESLSFNSGDYELRPIATETAQSARAGSAEANLAPSSITASGLRLNMDLHLRQDAEDETESEPSTEETEQSTVERIDIHQLHFDSIALQGYRLILRQKGVYIDIPAGLDASIKNIDLHGPLPDQPFSIRLDTRTPVLLGSISTGALLAQQVGVQMGNSLRARLDFEAASANLGFLEATDPDSDEPGPMRINLTDWSATNILAYIGEGTSTRLRAGRSLGDGGVGGEAIDIELGEDGSIGVRLRGLWARGFELRDRDLGAELVLGQMTMPEDNEIEYVNGPSDITPGNLNTRVRIRHLDVDTANFVVRNLSHMIHALGGPDIQHALTTTSRTPDTDAAPDTNTDTDPALLDQSVLTWIRNHQALFDSLQGSISADVQFPTGSVTYDVGTLHPQLDLQIEDGNLNIDQMEDQLSRIDELGGTTAGLANLKFDPDTSEPTLVFGIGGHVLVQPSDPSGMPVGEPSEADLHYNLYEWRMGEDEMRVIRASRRINISRLLQVEQGNFDPNEEEDDEDEIPQSLAHQFRGLRVNDFALNLSTNNTDSLPISLGEYGSLELSPQSLQDLSITGNLQRYNFEQFEGMRGERIFQSLHRDSTTREGNFGLNLEQLALQNLDIEIPAFGNYACAGIEGDVTIGDVRDVSLDFRGLVPRMLSGTVGAIHLRNVEVNLEEFVPYGPPAPQADPRYRDVPIFREGEEEHIP